MKKFILGACCFLIATSSFSQSFGVHVGGNLASAKIKDDQSGLGISPKSKFGFLIGGVADVPFSSSVSFRPELNFIQKGFKLSLSGSSGGVSYSNESEATMNYLELPLNFVYKLPAGANQVFLGAGPSFGYGLSGKSKTKESGTGIPTVDEEEDIHFGGDENDDDFKPFDFGANILGGYQMTNGMFFKVAYSFGFSNISHDPDASFKNKGFSFSIGYLFSKAGEGSK